MKFLKLILVKCLHKIQTRPCAKGWGVGSKREKKSTLPMQISFMDGFDTVFLLALDVLACEPTEPSHIIA